MTELADVRFKQEILLRKELAERFGLSDHPKEHVVWDAAMLAANFDGGFDVHDTILQYEFHVEFLVKMGIIPDVDNGFPDEDEEIILPKRDTTIDVWDQRKLGVFPKPDGSVELFYGVTLEGDDDDQISHTLEIAEAAMNAKIFFKKAIAEDDPELRREFFKTAEKFSDLHGSLEGWWELDSNGRKMAFAKVVNISEFEEHENTMAHVLAKVGVFESVSEAKRNGWNKPIELGEQFFKKKTVRLMIVKE